MVFFNKLHDIAEAFSKYFKSAYSSFCSGTFSSISQHMEILSLAPISNSDVQNAIKRLRPSKLVRLDDILISVIKTCPEIFVAVRMYIFNFSLSQNIFPKLWKQAVIVPVFKEGETSSVGNYKPIALLRNVSKF
jgi:hypothetical protein